MNSEAYKSLRIRADEIAVMYSDQTRELNYKKDVFEVDTVIVLSDTSAGVIYRKTSGLKVLFFFHYSKNSKWYYFVPTDAHILGLQRLTTLKFKVEEYNGFIRGSAL